MKMIREILAVTLSVTLFVISLTQDGFYTGAHNPWPGWNILLTGWLELMYLKVNWFANPVLLLAYFFMLIKQYGLAAIASLTSVIFAASFLARKTIVMDTISHITGYGIGYWLWLASFIIMLLSSLYLFYVSRREVSRSIDNSSEKSE